MRYYSGNKFRLASEIERNKILDSLVNDVKHLLEMLADPNISKEEIEKYVKNHLIK